MSDDAYRTDLFLTADGDLAVGRNGGLTVLAGPLNCAQALRLRVRTFPGELPLHQGYGSLLVDRLVGHHASDPGLMQSIANAELREILRADPRFLAGRNLLARGDSADPKRVLVSCDLELVGGDAISVSSLTDPRLDEIETRPLTLDAITSDLTDTDAAALLAVNADELADQLPPFEGDDTFTADITDDDTEDQE